MYTHATEKSQRFPTTQMIQITRKLEFFVFFRFIFYRFRRFFQKQLQVQWHKTVANNSFRARSFARDHQLNVDGKLAARNLLRIQAGVGVCVFIFFNNFHLIKMYIESDINIRTHI